MADHTSGRPNPTHSDKPHKTTHSSKPGKKGNGKKKGSSITGEVEHMFNGLTRGSTFAGLCGRSPGYRKPNLRRA